MGLLNKLTQEGSDLSKSNGQQPDEMRNIDPNSPLHNKYSLNGNPNLPNYPSPSSLDLDGQKPEQYLDNLPN